MTATLSDVLLVLLREQRCDVHELQQRHERLFGLQDAVAHGRVLASLTRLERQGYVGAERSSATPAMAARRRFTLTPAGQSQQATWMRDLTTAADADDFYVRGMLAVVSTERDEFDQLINAYLDAVEQRQAQARQRFRGGYTAEDARAAYDEATLRALTLWLRQLGDAQRARDMSTGRTQRRDGSGQHVP